MADTTPEFRFESFEHHEWPGDYPIHAAVLQAYNNGGNWGRVPLCAGLGANLHSYKAQWQAHLPTCPDCIKQLRQMLKEIKWQVKNG